MVEHSFDFWEGVMLLDTAELDRMGDVELIEELSLLTTQAGRMRARMADIVAELDRRRQTVPTGPGKPAATGSHAAGSW